jgi:MFS transporter, AAHS family, 4-hydroxybenzoate transporter
MTTLTTTTVPTVDVGAAIDAGSWSGYQKWLVAMTAAAIVFDGFDNQLLGLALPSIMGEWALPRSAFASVVSFGYLGMMIGGAGAGVVGDRFGRRVALVGSTLLFGAATCALGMVDDLTGLTVLRFVAGIGLGGALPNGAALAAEYVPARQRAMAVTLAIVCVPVGGTLAGLFAAAALPAAGWRGLFAIGGAIPVLSAFALWWSLPESPRFLARHPDRWPELHRLLRRMGHAVPGDARFVDPHETSGHSMPFTSLFAGTLRRETCALWVAFLSCLLAVYLGFSWLPSLLTSAGLGVTVASTGLTAFNLGGVVGAVAGGAIIRQFGSRLTMLAMAAGASAGAIGLSALTFGPELNATLVLVMLALTGGLINAVQTTMYALAAHIYPAMVRATGVGAASAFGRLGAILSGYAGPWALELRGSQSFFSLMAATLAITFLALAVVRRHIPPSRGTDRV